MKRVIEIIKKAKPEHVELHNPTQEEKMAIRLIGLMASIATKMETQYAVWSGDKVLGFLSTEPKFVQMVINEWEKSK